MTKEEYWVKNKTKLQLNERSYNAFEMGVKFCENKIADIKANCDYILEGKEIEYREERKKLCDDLENMKATLESKIAELKAENELIKNSDSLCKLIGEQKLQIEKMKSDVIKHFGEENNVLVARLLKEWEMKENGN